MKIKTDYSYQKEIISKCYKYLIKNKKVVLAASCGAGKTSMSIEIIRKYLNTFPNDRVLILTHGQSILRSQYYSVIKEYFPLEDICLLDSSNKKINSISSKNIVVTLPQTIINFNDNILGKFGLIIVDEAHNYYLVDYGIVERILERTAHKCELLLTGSPSKFISQKDQFEILNVSSSELLEFGVIIDPNIYLLKTSHYQIDLGEYYSKNEIRKRRIDINLTKEVIHEVIRSISNMSDCNLSKNKSHLLSLINKMMVVAIDEQHAFEIYEIIKQMGFNTVISTYSFDPKSENIEKFKMDSNIQVIVVVQRGILGFNYPDLQCLVDISLSLNPDRIFQMINRVVRLSQNRHKFFIKVMPENLVEIGEIAISCASALSVKDVYETYQGNYKNIYVPILNIKEFSENKEGKLSFDTLLPDISYIPSFSVMKRIFNNKNDDVLRYSWTSFQEVREKLTRNYASWTKEKCIIEAKKYNKISEWKINNWSSYNFARKNTWYRDCITHMSIVRNPWTLEECKLEALKYKKISEWKKLSSGSYTAAFKNNWINDCTLHLIKNKKWTLQSCLEIAKKYQRPVEWKNDFPGCYSAAINNGWLKECSLHMENTKRRSPWTKEECILESKKFPKISAWKIGSSGSFQAARKNNWLKYCKFH